MKPTTRRHALSFATLLLAAACVSPPRPLAPPPHVPEPEVAAQQRRQQAARPAYNLTGYPPAVRDGYIDGCESAKKTAYARRDARRMDADPQYKMGWDDGFSICKKK
jgi:hypothetical protein